MIHFVICDDEPEQRQKTAELLRRRLPADSLSLQLYPDGKTFLDAVEMGLCQPDIVLLDIVLGDENGIRIAESLNRRCPDCSVIYVSSYLNFALDVYDTRHSYFILKSQLSERLGPALDKVLSDRSSPSVSFREAGALRSIPLRKVLYFERNLKKTIIRLADGRSCQTAEKPAELLAGIENSGFIQCHQSYHVNMAYVSGMRQSAFLLVNDEEIPISRRWHADAKEAFLRIVSRLPQSL